MKCFVFFFIVLGVDATLEPGHTMRPKAGTGWRGKVSKYLPGPLARRLTYNTATGYDTTNKKCIMSHDACPGPANSVCTGFGAAAATPLCGAVGGGADANVVTALSQLYTWAASTAAGGQAADTVFNIASGVDWNQWGSASDCGPSGCASIYKKAILLYDEANCWPKSKAVPIIVNSRDGTHDEQLQLCAKTVKHMLGKKPLGSFLRSPVEQLERIVQAKVMITCGNTAMEDVNNEMTKKTTVAQYPYLEGEGGGGTFGRPGTYAEHTGMCGSWNTDLSSNYQTGGTRFGGTVTTEEYGHTFFDIAIAQNDPQGWLAVQQAEAAAADRYVANNNQGHERDSDWDCFTAATEYFAAGVEMLLYNVRIGENLKATTRSQLKTQEPALWCLALRHYELNNQFTPCSAGPTISDVTQDVDCKTILGSLGVTVFGPDGSVGAKGGGAKNNSALEVSSTAVCPADAASCAAYVTNTTTTTGGTTTDNGTTTAATTSTVTGGTAGIGAASSAPPAKGMQFCVAFSLVAILLSRIRSS